VQDLLVPLGRKQADPRAGVGQDHVRHDGRAVKEEMQVGKRDPDLLADGLDAFDHPL